MRSITPIDWLENEKEINEEKLDINLKYRYFQTFQNDYN